MKGKILAIIFLILSVASFAKNTDNKRNKTFLSEVKNVASTARHIIEYEANIKEGHFNNYQRFQGSVFLDSIITYKFYTDSDSVFSKKKLFKSISNNTSNSELTYSYYTEEISFIWDTLNYKWQFDEKVETNHNSNGLNRLTYKWDIESNNWLELKSIKSVYDNNGNTILFEQYEIGSDKNLYGIYKFEYEFDEFGNETMFAYYNWSAYNKIWVGQSKNVLIYDENSSILYDKRFEWNNTVNVWILKYVYDYSQPGYYYIVNEYNSNGSIINKSKILSEYDAVGKKISEYTYEWENANWVPKFAISFSYDINNNIIEEKKYFASLRVWNAYYKIEYEYDANNNEILEISYSWDSTFDKWVGSLKYENEYDIHGNLINSASYEFDESSGIWIGMSRTEKEYNEDGKTTYSGIYEWDFQSNEWILMSFDIIAYDIFGKEYSRHTSERDLINGGLSSSWIFTTFNKDGYVEQKNYSILDRSTLTLVINEKEFYYYSIMTNHVNIAYNDLIIYPNPVNSYFCIQGLINGKLYIYNLNGEKVMTTIYSGEPINISNFKSGTYLIVIQNDKNYYRAKIIKK